MGKIIPMKKLPILAITFGVIFISCRKNLEEMYKASTKIDTNALVSVDKMSDIKVPDGFKWQTSRDVRVKITTNDNNYTNALHKVIVYSADPVKGGIKLAEGSLSNSSAFEATINIANSIQEIFLVKVAPNQSKVMEKVKIINNAVNENIAVEKALKLNKSSGPDCTGGCSTTVNNPSGNLSYSSGTTCLTGNVSIGNLTISGTAVVRICGTGSLNNLNFNSSSSQLVITSTGNINFNSSTSINGQFVNYGTVSSNANANININSTGTFTNHGILNAGKNFNPNGSSVIVNNGTIDVDEKLTNNSGCDFTNNCKLIVHDDFQNNGLFKNYGYVRCYDEATIQGGSNNEFKQYNGAMLSTYDIQVNGTITGFGITSLIKVTNKSKGNAQGLINGAQNYCDVNGIEGPWNATIGGGATQNCNLYIPTSICNPEGSGNPPIIDTDEDGVADGSDCYPNDPSKAYCNSYGPSTVAFEDMWPFKGDYDLNDMVVNYTYTVITNAANNVVRVEANYILRATGGSFNNGFAVQFPVNRNLVSGVTGATLESGQTKAVLVLFNNMRNEMQMWNTIPGKTLSAPVTYNVAFNISNGPSLVSFGLGAYNPFIWNNTAGFGRGYEVHLPGQLPTDLVNTGLFGTGKDGTNLNTGDTYVSNDGRYPWAINIPATFDYPVEKADINTAYTKFATWVSSGGASFNDWYTNTNGYRNNANIY
jgi:LruC domain-containing protein